jgi:hypothetical protein
VQLPRDVHVRLFGDALADAGVAEDTTVVFLVEGHARDEEAEVVYIPPPHAWRHNYPLLERVGEARIHENGGLHRFAAYQEVDDAPLGAIATELRHEVQHAVQFNQYGPHFAELNQLLRDLVRITGRAAYEEIPSERDANHAAAAYAANHYADDLPAMADDDRFRQYTGEIANVNDLLAGTVAMVWQLAARDQRDEHAGRRLGEVVDELAENVAEWHRRVIAGADLSVRREADQEAVVEIPAG